MADEWHAIKPGTDMAFFLSLAHVIVTEKRYDPAYAAEKLYGFKELEQHVQQYTPEWAA
ncbi:MAG: molybdopterin-dependent oxidoreductase, partial [Rhodospirillaceae bacterium]|nr:molybdopterin-dependent oxidoreductase [Rhodospirillaceae bacterium]